MSAFIQLILFFLLSIGVNDCMIETGRESRDAIGNILNKCLQFSTKPVKACSCLRCVQKHASYFVLELLDIYTVVCSILRYCSDYYFKYVNLCILNVLRETTSFLLDKELVSFITVRLFFVCSKKC